MASSSSASPFQVDPGSQQNELYHTAPAIDRPPDIKLVNYNEQALPPGNLNAYHKHARGQVSLHLLSTMSRLGMRSGVGL